MLARISIRDIILIDRLDIEFAPGLSVLTGETGTGKSILLDALALALGARGDSTLVRHGAEQGQVTAAFEIAADHPARAILADTGIQLDDSLLLRRVQLADGRSRAYVNDQPLSVQLLKTLGAALVEIHGQHDERALVNSVTHRHLLDAYGGLEAEQAALAQLWRTWRGAVDELAAQRTRSEQSGREAEWLRHAVEELRALDPRAQEEPKLVESRTVMMQSEKLAADLGAARDLVAGTASPVPSLAAAVRRLEKRAPGAQTLLDPAIKAVNQALAAMEEARGSLEQAIETVRYDPGELDRIEERLFALRAASRKYHVAIEDLPALCARYSQDVADLDAEADRFSALERSARETEAQYRAAAAALSAARRGAAAALERAVNAELPALRLRARFLTQIVTDPETPGPEGNDRVEFWVETNPGSQPGPLMKVASGGELARFLLALKVVLADRGSAPTLIFDEIDTGAGGAIADAVGLRLARLAERIQVIAVTHAPQVAARADRHYLITKQALERGRKVATRVAELAPHHRREEIARMLAGAEITEEARAAAGRLIEAAVR